MSEIVVRWRVLRRHGVRWRVFRRHAVRRRIVRRGGGSFRLVVLGLALALVVPSTAHAYVGPGAGFAFLSSFLVLFTTLLLGFVSLLTWPFRAAKRLVLRLKNPQPRIKRLIVVGLDGQDPGLTDRFLAEGKLPNFQRLAEQGCYRRLATTFPSVSPVAWSSFSTGTHPARHNIFDFLDRDRRTYLPVLSSTKIGEVERFLRLGKFRIPLEKPELRLLRKSKPFWSVLGEHKIWSTVLRVPITFPPEKFYGAQLSAMCVPDLLGTQGTFLLFTTRRSDERFKEGGERIVVEWGSNGGGGRGRGARAAASGGSAEHGTGAAPAADDTSVGAASRDAGAGPMGGHRGHDVIETVLRGPGNEMVVGAPPLELPLRIEVDRAARTAQLNLDGSRLALEQGKLSDWVQLEFPAAPGVKVRGITRMMLTEVGEHFSLYVAPLNIDPEKPAMPISHPSYYAVYLAKKLGKYATLGLAEDTWALNEGVIDDGTFLKMTYDIDRERERQFFAALEKLRQGSLVCVFDATDRIQHMFWRYLEDGHPARAATAHKSARSVGGRMGGRGDAASADARTESARPSDAASAGPDEGGHEDAIERLYEHNDALVGRVMEELRDGDVLMVISDHGFTSFRRGVNLNRWLLDNGYLALKDGAAGDSEWLRDVDWSRTRAYALGLTGMFLNVKGREEEGVVEPEAAAALKREIIGKLSGLLDEERGEVGIAEAFDTAELYAGPYLGNAPDLLIGYNPGYRVSWDCATGVVSGPVFEDNTKAWSGDHCIDPRQVPGVLFSNRDIDADDPALIDIAPTACWLFGITPPAYMDGKVLFAEEVT